MKKLILISLVIFFAICSRSWAEDRKNIGLICEDIDNSVEANCKNIPSICYSKCSKTKKMNIIWASSFMFQKFQNFGMQNNIKS